MTLVQLETAMGPAQAAMFVPERGAGVSLPGLVVVHEWWGLNDSMRAMGERFAETGFAVLAVDLYAGRVADNATLAHQLMMELNTLSAVAIVESAAAYLKARVACPKVGVTGFCLGGAMTLAAACHCPSASAFVPFYGLPMAKHVDWSKTLGPIQGHYAERDVLIQPDRVRAAAAAVNEAGGSFDLHFYDAKHAFMRADDATVYNADAAALAWSRAIDFLKRHVC